MSYVFFGVFGKSAFWRRGNPPKLHCAAAEIGLARFVADSCRNCREAVQKMREVHAHACAVLPLNN